MVHIRRIRFPVVHICLVVSKPPPARPGRPAGGRARRRLGSARLPCRTPSTLTGELEMYWTRRKARYCIFLFTRKPTFLMLSVRRRRKPPPQPCTVTASAAGRGARARPAGCRPKYVLYPGTVRSVCRPFAYGRKYPSLMGDGKLGPHCS